MPRKGPHRRGLTMIERRGIGWARIRKAIDQTGPVIAM